MKPINLVARGAIAFALLAFAAPALPCGDMKTHSASNDPAPPAFSVPKDAAATKATPADKKNDKAKSATAANGKQKKSTTATN